MARFTEFARFVLLPICIIGGAMYLAQCVPTADGKARQTREIMRTLRNATMPVTADHLDAWENAMVVYVVERGEFVHCRSAGPDGLLLTDDDIVLYVHRRDPSLDR